MLTSPQALDWNRLPHISNRIIWTSETYQQLSGRFVSTSAPHAGVMDWRRLPFESSQLDKFPNGGGIYIFTFTFNCLEFFEQEMVLYLGEAESIQNRMRQHWQTSQGRAPQISASGQRSTHLQRMGFLFSSFQKLKVSYCVLGISADERKELERQMIGVLDPPFNWEHRDLTPLIVSEASRVQLPLQHTPSATCRSTSCGV